MAEGDTGIGLALLFLPPQWHYTATDCSVESPALRFVSVINAMTFIPFCAWADRMDRCKEKASPYIMTKDYKEKESQVYVCYHRDTSQIFTELDGKVNSYLQPLFIGHA